MNKEIMVLKREESQNIVWKDCGDLYNIIIDEIIDSSRWSIKNKIVIQRISDKKYFTTNYSQGATEMQDESPFEYEAEVVWTEVFPVEKTVIVYE